VLLTKYFDFESITNCPSNCKKKFVKSQTRMLFCFCLHFVIETGGSENLSNTAL
jgi:hypothetical protein